MQEEKHGVIRLLGAIQRNIDDSNIERLAHLLNYYPPQLEEDIRAIDGVMIMDREEEDTTE